MRTLTLSQWQLKHGIDPGAMAELRTLLEGDLPDSNVKAEGNSESFASQQIELAAPKHGVWLSRNNVGACVDQEGNFIRYGIANKTKQMNQKYKSGDFIGITQVLVTTQMVGTYLGVFTSVEVKKPGWKFSGKGREEAQKNWADFIFARNGLSYFATGPQDIWL